MYFAKMCTSSHLNLLPRVMVLVKSFFFFFYPTVVYYINREAGWGADLAYHRTEHGAFA